MEVFAYSLIPAKPLPYLHLGYTAAYGRSRVADVPGVPELQVLSIFTTLAGLVLLSSITKNAPKWRKAGWITLISSIAVFITLMAIPFPMRYTRPRAATRLLAQIYYNSLMNWISTSNETSIDLVKLRQTHPELTEKSVDAWKREMRVTQIAVNGPIAKEDIDFRVTSAGEDGVFDTEDDLSYP